MPDKKQTAIKNLIVKHEKQLLATKDIEEYKKLSAKQKEELNALLWKHR
jgi:hypothetical protein